METNKLYPVFLKLERLNVLIIGAGKIGEEKLHFLLKSSPNARVTVVAHHVSDPVKQRAREGQIQLLKGPYSRDLLYAFHLVIAATNDAELNRQISEDCRSLRILVNVADHPELCDFYLGGIVTKGPVKIAVSTNGESPVLAKRIRQILEQALPEEIEELALNLGVLRKHLDGDFATKVHALNALTKQLLVR